MPAIWDLIAAREPAAEHLREQIAKLSAELRLAETELAELAITRKTLTNAGLVRARPPRRRIVRIAQ